MSTYDWLALGVVAICLLLSAFFAGSETALTASSRARMHRLEKQGNRRAAVVNRLLQARERLIGALLLGNNAVNKRQVSLALKSAVIKPGKSQTRNGDGSSQEDVNLFGHSGNWHSKRLFRASASQPVNVQRRCHRHAEEFAVKAG